jgi:hypothetical protein
VRHNIAESFNIGAVDNSHFRSIDYKKQKCTQTNVKSECIGRSFSQGIWLNLGIAGKHKYQRVTKQKAKLQPLSIETHSLLSW